ncbi:MAG TPA: archease [Candidatus Bathyarchaeia archaeon]|nr:archease [Candidatus Bathyarchaeia archaeon]
MRMDTDFIELPHTGDIKIRAYGKTKEELFCHALAGMFQSARPVVDDPACRIENGRVMCQQFSCQRHIVTSGPDMHALLVNFLSDALYFSDIHNEAYFDATIEIMTDMHIAASIHGVPVKGFAIAEIKAVTYHDLTITHHDDTWQADIVFDI